MKQKKNIEHGACLYCIVHLVFIENFDLLSSKTMYVFDIPHYSAI